MKHKTLIFVVLWLIFLVIGMAIQTGCEKEVIPLVIVTTVAGCVSLGYITGAKSADLLKALNSPAGVFGFDYKPKSKSRTFWTAAAWIFIIAELLICMFIQENKTLLPVNEVFLYGGATSVIYVSLDKGTKVAAAAELPKRKRKDE